MPSGGPRANSGRPEGINTSWSREAQERLRSKIQTEMIIQRLNKLVAGEIKMLPAAVTAALGLLKKAIPDLTYVEHSGEIVTSKVIRGPAIAASVEAWADEHVPQRTSH